MDGKTEKRQKKSQEPVESRGFSETKKEATVKIQFRENRKFDLHIGRNMIIFRGRVAIDIPKSWIVHKDFKPVEHLFIIKKGV